MGPGALGPRAGTELPLPLPPPGGGGTGPCCGWWVELAVGENSATNVDNHGAMVENTANAYIAYAAGIRGRPRAGMYVHALTCDHAEWFGPRPDTVKLYEINMRTLHMVAHVAMRCGMRCMRAAR